MSISPLIAIAALVLLTVVSLIIWLRRSRTKTAKLEVLPEVPSAGGESVVERIESNATAVERTPIPADEPRTVATLMEPQPLPEAHELPVLAVTNDSPKILSCETEPQEVEILTSATTDAAIPCAQVAQIGLEQKIEVSDLDAVVTHETTEIENINSEEIEVKPAPEELSPLGKGASEYSLPVLAQDDITASHHGHNPGAIIQPKAPNQNAVVAPIAQLLEEGPSEETKIIPEDAYPNKDGEPSHGEATNEAEPIVANDNDKAPQRYRPPSQPAPRQPRSSTPTQPVTRNGQTELTLDIRLRLTRDRFGFCRLALLPERKVELDEEITVRHGGVSLGLTAQEDWYQDLEFSDTGDLLRNGIELKGKLSDNRRVRWLLTARNLFVLASHQKASGFVSSPRMTLGRTHIILCTTELQEQVEAILILAGCSGYAMLQGTDGMPAGWIGFRDVSPTKSLPLDAGSDSFYAIKPAPDIEIDLDGGICLHNAVWLAGHPPKIKLLGEANVPIKVLIDGKEAQHTSEGHLITDGYDSLGQHSIYCEGLSCSRTYTIEEPSESWDCWSAYKFDESDICGPLVQLVAKAASRRVITVPMSTPLLLGAEPGQIFRCSPRNVTQWKGFVPFDVVWALPAYPLRCDKKTARILQFANAPFSPRISGSKAALDWCSAILDASRKGLRVESNSAGAATHWHEYKKEARKMWRAAR